MPLSLACPNNFAGWKSEKNRSKIVLCPQFTTWKILHLSENQEGLSAKKNKLKTFCCWLKHYLVLQWLIKSDNKFDSIWQQIAFFKKWSIVPSMVLGCSNYFARGKDQKSTNFAGGKIIGGIWMNPFWISFLIVSDFGCGLLFGLNGLLFHV